MQKRKQVEVPSSEQSFWEKMAAAGYTIVPCQEVDATGRRVWVGKWVKKGQKGGLYDKSN